MTEHRKLGPAIAIPAAAIVGEAIIAGFVIVGSPGDARNQRLDEMTEDRIADLVRAVQCAYYANGDVREAIEQVTVDLVKWSRRPPIVCNQFDETGGRQSGRTAAQPAETGDVTYQRLGSHNVRVCASFRLPNPAPGWDRHPRSRGDVLALFPTLWDDHVAGAHCYDLQLQTQPTG